MTDFDLEMDQVKIGMTLSERDYRLPSFALNMTISLDHPTGQFSYCADNLWFACDKWDGFINKIALMASEKEIIVLTSMSEEFTLKISTNVFEILIKENSFDDARIVLSLKKTLSHEDIYKFNRSFFDFDKWWR